MATGLESDFELDLSSLDLSSLNETFEDVTLGDGVTEEKLDAFGIQLQDDDLAELGLTREDVDPAIFKDDVSFAKFYQEGLTDKNQTTRDEFNNLYKTDQQAFAQAYDKADSNTRLNFLYDRFKDGELDKDLYTQLAGKVLQDSTDENFKPNITYFENAGKLYEVSNQFLDTKNPLFHAREVVLFDEQKLNPNKTHYLAEDTENFRRSLGSVNTESADTRSSWVKARDKVIRPMLQIGASIATGGQSDALFSAVKLASGETLKSEDWANLASFGLEKFNIGSDLTQAAVTSAITGDPTDLILEAGGAEAVTDALGKAGVPQELLDDPDFMSGVEEAIGTVAGGGDIQDALESGLTEYVKEGGGFGVELPDAPDIDIDLGAIGDVVSNIASGVRDVGSQIGDVTDPLLSTIGDVGSATEDVVRDVGSEIAEAAQPFKEPVETIGRGIDDYLLQPVKDALLTGGGALVAQPSGTRTTDGLFSSELFKFSPVEFTDVGRTQPRQAPQELIEDIDSNPFAGS
jgi:hypothetical protein